MEHHFLWYVFKIFWYKIILVTINAFHIETKSQKEHLTVSEGII